MSILTALLAIVGCSSNPAGKINKSAPPGRGMSLQKLKLADGSTRNVSVFLPYAYDEKQIWPTVVFLQGLGEGGSDGVKNTTVGLGPAIAKRASTFPFIALFPQSGGPWSSAGADKLAMDVLAAAQAKYRIDPKRIYLTGMSTGGYGTWAIGARHADRFAALVPLCGYSGEAFAPQLTQMPIWAFHNSVDPFVFSSSTKATVNQINKLGGHAKMTIYNAIGHDCWSSVYGDDALWSWIAQQHK